MAQTVILICCLVTIPVFVFAYFLYLKTTLDLSAVFEKSFSAAFGFFGGAATLAAAYIASRLFNDWKDEKTYEIEKDLLTQISDILSKYYKFEYDISTRFIKVKKYHLSNNDIFLIIKAKYVDQPDFYEDFKVLFSKIKHLENINPEVKINTECNLFYNYYLNLRDINKYAAMNYNMFSNFIKDPLEDHMQVQWGRRNLKDIEITNFEFFLADLRKETIINGEMILYEDMVEKFKDIYYKLNNIIINFTNPKARK